MMGQVPAVRALDCPNAIFLTLHVGFLCFCCRLLTLLKLTFNILSGTPLVC